MGDQEQFYDDGALGESPWQRRERIRDEQEFRLVAIRAGDALLDVGRWYAKRGGKYMRMARRPLVSAAQWFTMAGMTHKAHAVVRLGQMIHRAEYALAGMPPVDDWRTPRQHADRQPTKRMHDLADAVERLTAEQGRPPSWPDIARALGIRRPAARELAMRARKRGLVTFTDGVARTIRVVGRTRLGTEGRS